MCNTLNVCCIPVGRAGELVPVVPVGARRRRRGTRHLRPAARRRRRRVLRSGRALLREGDDPARRRRPHRAGGDADRRDDIGTEWEWEGSPEVTLVVTESVDEAVALHNRYSPRFIASLISDDVAEHERFYAAVDAPFVGDGFTRWVDGQFAFGTPELGLSNWQFGRLLGRGGVLSGESIHTIRHRATIHDPTLHR